MRHRLQPKSSVSWQLGAAAHEGKNQWVVAFIANSKISLVHVAYTMLVRAVLIRSLSSDGGQSPCLGGNDMFLLKRAVDRVEKALEIASPFYDKLFYFPGDKTDYMPSGIDQSNVNEEFVTLESGDSIHVWRLTCPNPRMRVIHFHGSGFNMSSHYPHVAWLPAHDCEVIMFDYPGYGRSTGVPTRRSTVDTAYEIASRYSAETKLPTFLFGQSLGGNIAAVALARRPQLSKIQGAIIDSMYSSFQELGALKIRRKYTPRSIFAAKLIAKFISETDAPLNLASKVEHPLLILHSRNDEIVPWSESVRFYERVASADVEFVSHLNSGHTAVFQNDISDYRKMMLGWMEARRRS